MNDSIIKDITMVNEISREDLVDLYEKLIEINRSLTSENDLQKQKIYHQSQQIRTLTMSQTDMIDLQSEIDSVKEYHKRELHEVVRKHSTEIEKIRKEKNDLEAEKIISEEEICKLRNELKKSYNLCEELKEGMSKIRSKPRQSFSLELKEEIENLGQRLLEMKAKFIETENALSDKIFEIEQLREKIACLEGNLESKKSDLEEKNDLIENLQQKYQEISMELSLMKSVPEDEKRKGNSLFAEVDDQRQKMKTILQQERVQYLQMKKSFNSKEIEIRRLKRENQNIRSEIQSCAALLRRGEKVENEALRSQILQLHADNKRLEEILKEAQQKVMDLANQQNLGWIESILLTTSREKQESKDKLMQIMIEKTSLAHNLMKEQRELVKTRLDNIKLKNLIEKVVEHGKVEIQELQHISEVDPGFIEHLKEFAQNSKSLSNESIEEDFEESSFHFRREILKNVNVKENHHDNSNISKFMPSIPTADSREKNSKELESSSKNIKEKNNSPSSSAIKSENRGPIVVKNVFITTRKK